VDRLAETLANLINSLEIPRDLLTTLTRELSTGMPMPPRVICRSSSNVEDLKGLSGAGERGNTNSTIISLSFLSYSITSS
jgi:hypothetical protein